MTDPQQQAALRQASFCLRELLPDHPDAQMTVRMIESALAASAPDHFVDVSKMVTEWRPIETAPPREEVVVFWIDHDGNERRDLEFWDEGVWCGWHDHAEHTEIIGGHGVPYTPPYTHWMRLGSPATPSVAEAGGTIKEDLKVGADEGATIKDPLKVGGQQ